MKKSVLAMFCAAMMLALQQMQSQIVPNRKRRKPIKVLIPVNLRKLFESETQAIFQHLDGGLYAANALILFAVVINDSVQLDLLRLQKGFVGTQRFKSAKQIRHLILPFIKIFVNQKYGAGAL